MNWLAHLFLAQGKEGWSVGALAGDFAKGPVPTDLPEDLQLGIRLHRRIDAWSDTHRPFLDHREHFPKPLRRYVGIYLDLAHDHFLTKHWDRYSEIALDKFIAEQLSLLSKTTLPVSPQYRRLISSIKRHDLLHGYGNWNNVTHVLRRIGRDRLSRPNRLAEGIEILAEHRDAFEKQFIASFPEVLELVREMKAT